MEELATAKEEAMCVNACVLKYFDLYAPLEPKAHQEPLLGAGQQVLRRTGGSLNLLSLRFNYSLAEHADQIGCVPHPPL